MCMLVGLFMSKITRTKKSQTQESFGGNFGVNSDQVVEPEILFSTFYCEIRKIFTSSTFFPENNS